MKNTYFLLFLMGITLLNACKKKEDDPISPKAAFSVSSLTVVVDQQIQFTNTSENATSFKWSFGDGTTSTEVSPKNRTQPREFHRKPGIHWRRRLQYGHFGHQSIAVVRLYRGK